MKYRLAVLVAAALVVVRPAAACMEYYRAVFTNAHRPDGALDRFARGRLGVLLPSYANSYLAVAYRHLSGHPLDDQEARAAEVLWLHRLGKPDVPVPQDANRAWNEARELMKEHSSLFIPSEREVGPQSGSWYLNCTAGAVMRAAETLRARLATFGRDSPGMRAWLDAQDKVFENCDGGLWIPAAPEPDLAPILAADRAYQIAAAYFYGAHFDEAAARFRAIATDRTSPWWEEAPYLAARALLRKGVLAQPHDREALGEARRQLEAVLADDERLAIHPRARDLFDFVSGRLDPGAQLAVLAGRLLASTGDPTLSHDLDDYTILFAKEEASPDPLTDWITTFQKSRSEGWKHARERWQETPTLPWLVAALAHCGANDPGVDELLVAAVKIPVSSPAAPTLALHRARLLAARGRPDQARRALDDVLALGAQRLPRSARNLLLAARLPLARNLEDTLRDLPRWATEIVDNYGLAGGAGPARPLLDVDGADLLNRVLPVALEARAASNHDLPASLRAHVLPAAWARAVLLGRHDVARELTVEIGRVQPVLGSAMRGYLDESDPEAAAFAAALVLLRRPHLGPFVVPGIGVVMPSTLNRRQEQWCPDTAFVVDETRVVTRLTAPPTFLDATDRAAASAEAAALHARPALLDGLYETVLARAEQHPDDVRVPEALHRAVARTGDRRCWSADTSRLSHAAFRLLHGRYAETTWARQTKYWY